MGAEFGAHGVREALAWGFDSSSRPPRHGGRRFWQRLDKCRGLCASTRTRTEAWTPSTFLKGVPEMMVPQDTVNPSARFQCVADLLHIRIAQTKQMVSLRNLYMQDWADPIHRWVRSQDSAI